LVSAVKLSADDAGTRAVVPPEAYCGLIRQGDPADAAALVRGAFEGNTA
jgi:hypothetical protein